MYQQQNVLANIEAPRARRPYRLSPASLKSAPVDSARRNRVTSPLHRPAVTDASSSVAAPLLAGLRVALVPPPGVFTAPGGGEIQLLSLERALRRRGIDAHVMRDEKLRWGRFDCIHLFGSCPQHLQIVAAARSAGAPVVLSPIAWFDVAARWFTEGTFPRRVRSCGGLLARAVFPALPSWRERLYRAVDLLMPNSHVEATQLTRFYRVAPQRIHVVPNGADRRFADGDGGAFETQMGHGGFVLCAGRIEPRKNQHRLLRAMHGTGARVVLIGDVVPGHQAYLTRCRREADERVIFFGHVAHDEPTLADAFAACGCLALVSWFETPGLAALEAAMTAAPLVLTNRGATREYFGSLADYASPRDETDIRRKVTAALKRPRNPALARLVRGRYTWHHAAKATCDAYQKVMCSV